jgi:hypothetical protein
VNLAADSRVNPLSEAFAKVVAVAAKQEYETRRIKTMLLDSRPALANAPGQD